MMSNDSAPARRFRERLRWRVSLPLSVGCAGLGATLGMFAQGTSGGTGLVWIVLFLIVSAGIVPLWADEARPGALVQSAVPWIIVAVAGASFLSWRTPDALGGAAVAMAAVAAPAGWLVAWLHRLRERRERKERA